MEGAPEICDFVFEEATGKGKDAVDHLRELEGEGAGWGFRVEGYATLGEEGGWGAVGKVEATVEIVESASY